MEVQKAITEQKIERQFAARNVQAEKIDAVIRAGNAVDFVFTKRLNITVITSTVVLDYIEEKARETWLESSSESKRRVAADQKNRPLCGAPVLIMLSAPDTETVMLHRLNAIECACATQNMILAAEELGLASCMLLPILEVFNIPEVHRRAELPAGDRAYSALLLGYAASPAPREQKPFANNVHYCS